MSRDYNQDRSFSDKFERCIKMYLGEHFFVNDFEKDVKENTDLSIFTIKPKTFACRIRTAEYYQNYKNEFTIRSSRDSGSITELSKIIDGFGDYMFYGFALANDNYKALRKYTIIDLTVFRSTIIRSNDLNAKIKDPSRQIPNGDGTYFYAFEYKDFPENLIIKSCEFNETKRKMVPLLSEKVA